MPVPYRGEPMAKRIVGVILAVLILFTLSACGGKETIQKTPAELAGEIRRNLEEYYTGRRLADYKEAAALYTFGFDFSRCDWSELVRTPQEGLKSYNNFLLSVYFLKKAGMDVSDYDTERYLGYLEEYVADPEEIPTTELSGAVIALVLYDREFDYFGVADNLLLRQDSAGGFYDYPKKSGENQKVSPEASAYALMAYQTIRPAVWSAKYNDSINDSTMEYLFYRIDEETDYTVKDHYGKASATATALCLTSLLSAGMTAEGDNAKCLLEGLNTFAVKEDENFKGFKEYYTDKTAYDEANACALLCVAATLHGNPLMEKKVLFVEEISQ